MRFGNFLFNPRYFFPFFLSVSDHCLTTKMLILIMSMGGGGGPRENGTALRALGNALRALYIQILGPPPPVYY